MALRVILMGTGPFAVPPFRAVLESHHEVVAVVTQPDRKGRGHHRGQPHPVRELAESFSANVIQPENVNVEESLDALRGLRPDLFLVASYGQILKQPLLDLSRFGCFNLHGSLLPAYRGAAPVQYAIRHGETRTGVTLFQIERSLDSGPIAAVVETEIAPDETSGELMIRLADLSGPLSLQFLEDVENGRMALIPQDHDAATLAPKIAKEEGGIDWEQSAESIHCHVRAMQPWPRASTRLLADGSTEQRVILWRTTCLTDYPAPLRGLPPGGIYAAENRLLVACGTGVLEIKELQPEGRKRISAQDFLNGHRPASGSRFQ